MSTKERYGKAVWEAITDMCLQSKRTRSQLMTVGEVARKAGVSFPTAKKYMTELVLLGCLKPLSVGRRVVYQYVEEGMSAS